MKKTKTKKRLNINFKKYFSLTNIKKGYFALRKRKPLLVKIIYTILIILIFRIGASITMPGVEVKTAFASGSNFLGILDMLGGGALRNLSIFALGIGPFITSSIIMQLLQSEAFPPMYRLAKSGPKGKRKINIITRVLTLIFAIMQAIVIISQFASNNLIGLKPDYNTDTFKYFILPFILVGGSLFVLFLGEQITNKGVGNGTSLIIFSGIVVGLPTKFKAAWNDLMGKASSASEFVGVINFMVYVVAFLILLFIITYVYIAQRQIPIQQTGAGLSMEAERISRLPIKLNPSGVLPVIFPLMLLSIPQQVVQLVDQNDAGRLWIMKNLVFTAPIGMSILIGLIILFSVGFSVLTFNPTQITENFKKQGTFIPGIRPGNDTEKYLTGVVTRLGLFSGFYLSAITVIKYIQELSGWASTYSFGGTSILILVSVAVETINQLQARNTSSKISKARISSLNKHESLKGLLW